MIRINLLPEELRKKQHALPRTNLGMFLHVIVGATILLAVVLGVMVQVHQLHRYQAKLDELKRERLSLAPQVAAVRKIEKNNRDLKEHLRVIGMLDKDRALQAMLLDEFARTVPEGLWISKLSEPRRGVVSVGGEAFSSLLIAEFMGRIESSELFGEPELLIAEQKIVGNRRVIEFMATFRVKAL